jgi:transposase InsO family protein
MSQSVLEQTGLSPQALCRGLELPYRSYCRWTEHRQQGRPVLLPPGPRKLGPLPLDALLEDLESLVHRAQRTRGTGRLHEHWQPYLGRRLLQSVVNERRRQRLRIRRRRLQRIRWLQPDTAWAIDATEYPKDAQGHRLYHVVVQDMATTFQFEPLLTLDLCGHEAATFLGRLFQKHRAPLLLKRDNGSVFNTPEVNALLGTRGVIPLNSPARYPRYNGAIEHGIGELKAELQACSPSAGPRDPQQALGFARWLVHKHNFNPRRLLQRQSAAQAYTERPRLRWSRRQRKEIFVWIGTRTKRMLRAMDHPNQLDVRRAWRHSVESWLRRQGLIEVSIHVAFLALSVNLFHLVSG